MNYNEQTGPFWRRHVREQDRYKKYCPDTFWASCVYNGMECNADMEEMIDVLREFNEGNISPEDAAGRASSFFVPKVWPDEGIYILYLDQYGLYGLGAPFSAYKIGLPDRMRKRWATLQTGTPFELRPIHVIETGALHWTEAWLHNALKTRRLDDSQEWFALSYNDLRTLLSISVLDRPKNAKDEYDQLLLFERFNPPDTKQESMFDPE